MCDTIQYNMTVSYKTFTLHFYIFNCNLHCQKHKIFYYYHFYRSFKKKFIEYFPVLYTYYNAYTSMVLNLFNSTTQISPKNLSRPTWFHFSKRSSKKLFYTKLYPLIVFNVFCTLVTKHNSNS